MIEINKNKISFNFIYPFNYIVGYLIEFLKENVGKILLLFFLVISMGY